MKKINSFLSPYCVYDCSIIKVLHFEFNTSYNQIQNPYLKGFTILHLLFKFQMFVITIFLA